MSKDFSDFIQCLRQNEASLWRDRVSARELPLTLDINPLDPVRGERSCSMSKVQQSQNAAPSCKQTRAESCMSDPNELQARCGQRMIQTAAKGWFK